MHSLQEKERRATVVPVPQSTQDPGTGPHGPPLLSPAEFMVAVGANRVHKDAHAGGQPNREAVRRGQAASCPRTRTKCSTPAHRRNAGRWIQRWPFPSFPNNSRSRTHQDRQTDRERKAQRETERDRESERQRKGSTSNCQ
jgi:hypothetical protein